MGGDTILYILVMIIILMMMEVPQFVYICVKKLIHIFDEPVHIRPKLCKSCGEIMSNTVFRNKRGEDGKIVWLKYKCIYCGVIHKVMK